MYDAQRCSVMNCMIAPRVAKTSQMRKCKAITGRLVKRVCALLCEVARITCGLLAP